jgi:hypothetical protein
MPIRTNEDYVGGIIDVDDGDDLTPFIQAASMLVDEKCLPVQISNPAVYTNARLEMIERWLAAHFYSVMRKRTVEEQVATIREKSEFKVDLGLQVTGHGQQVMFLDTAGGLAAWNNNMQLVRKIVGTLTWIGDPTIDECPSPPNPIY